VSERTRPYSAEDAVAGRGHQQTPRTAAVVGLDPTVCRGKVHARR
jgi:hypothetical protein